MIFALEFSDNLGNVRRDLDTLCAAFRELAENEALHQLLKVILRVGNVMNTGTAQGNAAGFRLSLLPKLPDIKSSVDSQLTLVHYLLAVCPTAVAAWPRDLRHLSQAEKLSLANAREFARHMAIILQQVVIPEGAGSEGVFSLRMRQFAEQAQEQLTALQADLLAAEEQFTRTMAFFGEDGTEMDPSTFLTTIAGFRVAWLKSLAEKDRAGRVLLPEGRRNSC